jgi:hypothetical protein
VSIHVDSLGHWQRITLDNGVLRASVLPELGGKMISLVRQASGREFLLPPTREYRRAAWGDKFEDFDTSGFDECLPTVAEGQYVDGHCPRRKFPDHGDLWSVPWQYEVLREELLLSALGSSLPYTFRKKLRFDGNQLVIEYEIQNMSNLAFAYLWSAHPLLQVEAGARVLLPDDVRELLIQWSDDKRLGKAGESCAYPLAKTTDGGVENLAIVKPPSTGTADKLFTPRLKTGFCGLHFPRSHESIAFRFDATATHYVGLWLCQGGWPKSSAQKHFTIALEPCNSRSDSLTEAVGRGACPVLAARSSERWILRIELCSGIPDFNSLPTR